MVTRILYDDRGREEWIAYLREQDLPITVSSLKGARRSLAQNSTLHQWFTEIGAQTGQTANQVKAECKLQYGVPIMIEHHPGWIAEWAPIYGPLNYQAKLKIFEFIPMTSLMTTRQAARFMTTIQHEYSGRGIILTDPEDLKYASCRP